MIRKCFLLYAVLSVANLFCAERFDKEMGALKAKIAKLLSSQDISIDYGPLMLTSENKIDVPFVMHIKNGRNSLGFITLKSVRAQVADDTLGFNANLEVLGGQPEEIRKLNALESACIAFARTVAKILGYAYIRLDSENFPLTTYEQPSTEQPSTVEQQEQAKPQTPPAPLKQQAPIEPERPRAAIPLSSKPAGQLMRAIFIIDGIDHDFEVAKSKNFDYITTNMMTLAAALESKKSWLIVSKSIMVSYVKYWKNYVSHAWENKKKVLEDWRMQSFGDFYIFVHNSNYSVNLGTRIREREIEEIEKYVVTNQKKPIKETLTKFFEKYSSRSHSWMLIFSGHGTPDEYIAGLTIPEFKNTLDICNQKISTKLFMYESCFAGGKNKITAFEDFTKNMAYAEQNGEKDIFTTARTYNFPIIALSSFDAPTQLSDKYPEKYDDFF